MNSAKTNKYWNHCIQCIRAFYPAATHKIVVIDDKSDVHFLKEDWPYVNVEYVQSEFAGRGELLPYYYFFKQAYFDNAVIIHDSVFFKRKINFDRLGFPVLPLWHFTEEKVENVPNVLRLASCLRNGQTIQKNILNTKYEILSIHNKGCIGCFGVQTYINHNFLCNIEKKYGLFKLLNFVECRSDRCALERIMGIIFLLESNGGQFKSLLGDIMTYCQWGYTWEQYCEDRTRVRKPLIKVWTGR